MSCSISIAIKLVAFVCFTYADFLQEQRYPEKNRLALNIKPINYKISIFPYIHNLHDRHSRKFTFDAECFIEIQAEKDTNELQLHMKNLDVELAEYYRKNTFQKTVLPSGSYNNLTDIQSYNLNKPLQANVSYILHFEYVGYINEENIGFYRRRCTNSWNGTEYVAATNFKRSNARRVFPCFDEPNFKATFDLTLTHDYSIRPHAPTHILDTINVTEANVYATTPKMSTFSLGFLYVPFLTFHYSDHFRVFARKQYFLRAKYISAYSNATLVVLEDYLGLPYNSMGNDRLNLVFVPGFPTTTTEIWGLITIPEMSFLNDDEHRTIDTKQNLVRSIAQGESLMWFGNLVTPEKWDFSWMKDGFGTYLGYFGGHMVNSSFRLDQQFVVDIKQTVMLSDFTMRKYPITVENISTLDSMYYDKYSSHKSACFIRMTKHILGEENFRKSLNEYLETHKYKNTVPSDLFTVWKKYWPEHNKKYATRFFKSFTTKVGFPVVTFNRTSLATVQISQKRFVPKDFDVVDQNLSYTVPISFTTNVEKDFENTSVKFFLKKPPNQITVNSDTKWIVGNIQAVGYYRVNYDYDTWQQIKQALHSENWGGIHELNRAQLVDDLFNFASAGEIDYSLALDVLEYLQTETNYLPWTSAFNGFKYLVARLGTENAFLSLHIRLLTERVYNKLGFRERKNDTPLDVLNRANVLNWSCRFGNNDCLSKAKTYFNRDLTENPVPIDIRSVVYCVAMREGNVEDFKKLYKIYQIETVESEKKMILLSLGCVKDFKLISKIFDMILSAEVDPLDKSDAIESLFSNNNENVEPVFYLIEKNFEKLINIVHIENVMNGLAYYLTTEAQIKRLDALDDKYKNDVRSFSRALSICKPLIDWSKANEILIKKFFEQNVIKQITPICSTLDVDSSFRLGQQFVVDIQQIVMLSDFTMRKTPMTADNISTLDSMYDKYSSQKGASFIRMTKHILGEQNFTTSLNEYMETHHYKDTVPLDLFTVWKKYWPEQYIQYADSFFTSYTRQVGFPVVTFHRTSANNVQISQKLFVPKDLDVSNQSLSYTIPISFTTSVEKDFKNTSVKVFLEKNPVQITVNSDTKWIMGNIQAVGNYRVNYDFNSWQQIRDALFTENWDGIHELNRAQMVDDLFHFYLSGEIEYDLAIDVLKYLKTETNYLPWTSAFNFFKFLIARLGTAYSLLSEYILFTTEKVYNELGFEEREDDTPLDILNRANVLNWACRFGKTYCILEAKTYFNRDLTENPVPTNIRSVVYCVAMREGNEQDFDKLYNMYKTETVERERKMILLAFGCVKDYQLISRVFHMILSAEVNRWDKSDAMESLFSNNNENVEPVSALIEQNFEKVLNALDIESVMYGLAYYLTTETQLMRLHALNNIYKNDFRSLNRAISRCETLIAWDND